MPSADGGSDRYSGQEVKTDAQPQPEYDSSPDRPSVPSEALRDNACQECDDHNECWRQTPAVGGCHDTDGANDCGSDARPNLSPFRHHGDSQRRQSISEVVPQPAMPVLRPMATPFGDPCGLINDGTDGFASQALFHDLAVRGRSVADTFGEMAGLMPDYIGTEKPAIRTQCHRNHCRNQKKVFFLYTTAIDRCAATALGRRVLPGSLGEGMERRLMAGLPNSCAIVVRVTKVQPQRAIVAQYASDLPEDFDQSRYILLRRFLPTDLIIAPYRAALAARSAGNFRLMRATPSSVHMRSCERLGACSLVSLR